MKNYKKLYQQAIEEVYFWKNLYYELPQEKQEDEPYCVEVFLKDGESVEFKNAINHNIDNFPCVYFKITAESGLVSFFKYDEVKYILAHRKVKDEQKHYYSIEIYDGHRE